VLSKNKVNLIKCYKLLHHFLHSSIALAQRKIIKYREYYSDFKIWLDITWNGTSILCT